tara:strand:- start:80 stop:853 length:774 start_codon:yes stop_codon:yes gene_type:complete
MIIAITGSSGYLAQNLIPKLKKKNSLYLYNSKKWDIRKPLIHTLKNVEVVFHFAGISRLQKDSIQSLKEFNEINYGGTKNVVSAFPNAKIIFISTISANDPMTNYARSKIMAEDFIIKNSKKSIILRVANVCGGKSVPKNCLLGTAIRASQTGEIFIYGKDYDSKDGTCIRNFIHIEDLINLLIRCIDYQGKNKKINVASDQSYTVKEFLDCFKKVNNLSFRITYKKRRKDDYENLNIQNISNLYIQTKSLKDMVKI